MNKTSKGKKTQNSSPHRRIIWNSAIVSRERGHAPRPNRSPLLTDRVTNPALTGKNGKRPNTHRSAEKSGPEPRSDGERNRKSGPSGTRKIARGQSDDVSRCFLYDDCSASVAILFWVWVLMGCFFDVFAVFQIFCICRGLKKIHVLCGGKCGMYVMISVNLYVMSFIKVLWIWVRMTKYTVLARAASFYFVFCVCFDVFVKFLICSVNWWTGGKRYFFKLMRLRKIASIDSMAINRIM